MELGSDGDVAKNNRDISIFSATITVSYNLLIYRLLPPCLASSEA